jgi:hypothetical protein
MELEAKIPQHRKIVEYFKHAIADRGLGCSLKVPKDMPDSAEFSLRCVVRPHAAIVVMLRVCHCLQVCFT